MKDLVERLREQADEVQATRDVGTEDLAELLNEAATKIDELRGLAGL